MGSTNCICTLERRFDSLLRRLEEAERRHHMRLVRPDRMDERIDSSGETQVFSTVDDSYGFWKIEINDRERDNSI